MKQPNKIKLRVCEDSTVERNHKEMMKFLNVTFRNFGWNCGQKEKWLYGRLRPWRKLRKMPIIFGKCVFWNIDRGKRRDVYYVQETINGWNQEAAFKGSFEKCGEWMDKHNIPHGTDNWNIVHEDEYGVDYL